MTTATAPATTTTVQAGTTEPELSLIDDILSKTTNKVQHLADDYQHAVEANGVGMLRRNVLTGMAIRRLKELLDAKIMDVVLNDLMNSPLGFVTDRGPHAWKADNKKPYEPSIVKDCLIQALLHGLSWCNNEFNILAGRFYISQNGYERKVRETPGLTDLAYSVSPSFAVQGVNARCVRACASWRLNGLPDKLIGTDGKEGVIIPIKTDDYSTEDQIIGKGLRKLLARVYRQANGSAKSLPDPDAEEPLPRPTVDEIPPPAEKPPEQPTSQSQPAIDQVFAQSMAASDREAAERGHCKPGDWLAYLLAAGERIGKAPELALWDNPGGKRDAWVAKTWKRPRRTPPSGSGQPAPATGPQRRCRTGRRRRVGDTGNTAGGRPHDLGGDPPQVGRRIPSRSAATDVGPGQAGTALARLASGAGANRLISIHPLRPKEIPCTCTHPP